MPSRLIVLLRKAPPSEHSQRPSGRSLEPSWPSRHFSKLRSTSVEGCSSAHWSHSYSVSLPRVQLALQLPLAVLVRASLVIALHYLHFVAVVFALRYFYFAYLLFVHFFVSFPWQPY